MTGVCRVILLGNLARNWEIRFTGKGTAVGNNSLAVNRKWKDGNGDTKEEAIFIPLVVWDKAAETLAEYQKKGDPGYFEGRLQEDKWEDKKSGEERRAFKVVVEQFQFIGGKGKDNGESEDRPRQRDRDEPRRRPREDERLSRRERLSSRRKRRADERDPY
jgi:single-strand DNA-binding protein